MKQIIFILALFSFTVSLAQEKYIFNGEITNPDFYIDFAFYSIGDPIDVEALKASYQKEFSDLKFSTLAPESIENNTFAIWHYENAQEDYAPMSLDYLKYFATSLSDRQQQMLAKSNEAVFFTIYGLSKDSWTLNKRLTEFMAKMSKGKKWAIFDSINSQYFTPEAWEETRLQNWNEKIPYIPGQITIHAYREKAFCRLVTMGMQKFGLPDIVVNNASCFTTDQTMNIMNILSQYLTTNKNIYKDQALIDLKKISNKKLRDQMLGSLEDNAKKKVILNFKLGTNEEGDPDNILLEIDFENKNYATPQLHQEQIISDLFGNTEEIAHISHDDAILKASEAAKAKLPGLKDLFNEGMDAGYSLLLKAPFEDDQGGSEWMWIEVTKWKGKQIKGLLQSEPFHIKGLKAGSTVSASQEDIFDYILYKPDGTQEGNKTQELILKAQGN